MLTNRKRWGTPAASSSGGGRVPVDQQVDRLRIAIPAGHEDVVAPRIEPLPRLQHHDPAVEARGELLDVVHVGVIDERARARQRQVRDERVARLDGRGQARPGAAPPGHAVGVALQLDAVPVDRRRLLAAG